MFENFNQIFTSFLVIMNPFTSLVYLLGISREFTPEEKVRAINSATFIAGATLVAFLLLGPVILSLLGVSMSSFQVAGGIVLLVISLRFMLGSRLSGTDQGSKDAKIMIIGVPLITGPGVLTTTMIMVGSYGYLPSLAGALAALSVVWLTLKLSDRIGRLLGERGLEISSRIMGLLLAAIAVEFLKRGVLTIASTGA